MVTLTIDDKNIQVQEGMTVLKAAQQVGIKIPTLCDHPELVPYGGCRLCLVEVDGFRIPQTSCTLPVSDNMVVRTNTDKIKEARKFVLSLIFSERNHFCPFCQLSGGDCELQNAAYAEGMTHWPLQPDWQQFNVDASHPFLVLDNNRCILCRRCARACSELVGNRTLDIEERGAKSLLIADFGTPLGSSTCVSCGTCLQVCPTGALIDRQSAYRGRVTDVETTTTICTGCSMGCGVKVMTRDNQIVRIEGDWDAAINHGLLCKEGRFMPLEENRPRLLTPMVKKDGALKASTWEEAFAVVSGKLKSITEQDGISAIASSRLSLEALSLFQDIFAVGLKSSKVTTLDEGQFTAASSAFAENGGQYMEGSIQALITADCVVCVGIDLAKHHEVLGFMVKRLLPTNASLIVIDSMENTFEQYTHYAIKSEKGQLSGTLKQLGLTSLDKTIAGVNQILADAKHPVIIYGKGLYETNGQEGMRALFDLARRLPGSTVLSPKGYSNSLAASLLGMDQAVQANGHNPVFLALGDDAPSERLLQKIQNAPFLVVQASFHSKATAKADVVLPVEMWAETEGHFLSFDGILQSSRKSLKTPEGIRSNEEVLRALAGSMGIEVDPSWKAKLSRRPSVVAIHEG